MAGVRIRWSPQSAVPMPAPVRASIEQRIAALWRDLDWSRSVRLLGPFGPWQTEDFELLAGDWRVTYDIDLLAGIAVVRQAWSA